MELLDKLHKMCRIVGPSLATSLESLVHCQNVATLSLFYRHYFGRCSTELAQLVLEKSTLYSDRLHNFSVSIPRYCKDVCFNSFFAHAGRPWNSLPIECFLLTYDLNDLQSRINRYLLTRFFLDRFPVWFSLFVLLFLVTRCLAQPLLFSFAWNESQ